MKKLLLVALAIGCGSSTEPGAAPDAGIDGATSTACAALFSKPGPHVPGVTTVTIDGTVTEIWYPATAAGAKRDVYDMRNWLPESERSKITDDKTPLHTTDAYRDVPLKAGKYPVVLFSHGLGGYRLQSSFLMTHLASWGYVVAAPDHVERGLALVLAGDLSKIEDKAADQLKGALAYLEKEPRFASALDLTKIAAIGHSMGGAAVSTVIDDPRIATGVWLASGGFGESPAGKSALMMWGTADRVAKASTIEQAFEKQPVGTRGVGVQQAGHMAFTDLCVIGRDRGGVLQIASDAGIKVEDLVKTLASDGCGKQPGGADYLAPEEGWPVINHYVTAHLQNAFDPATKSCFGDRVATLTTK